MPSRPNVLFLLSDEHSYRFQGRLSATEAGEPVRTPNLDRLAGQAAVFEQTYCQMPLCTPSHLCLLTGRHTRAAGSITTGPTASCRPRPPAAPTRPATRC